MTLEEPLEFNPKSWVILGVRPDVSGVVVAEVVVTVVDDMVDVLAAAVSWEARLVLRWMVLATAGDFTGVLIAVILPEDMS